jgi:heme oxygenase
MSGVLTPAERKLRAQLAVHTMHAANDPVEVTSTARGVLWRRFLDEVDPDRLLPKAERERRAGHARSAFFARVALARSRVAQQVQAAAVDEADA